MTYAIKAADELAKEGIEAEIIDLRTIRPMDVPAIVRSVQEDASLRHGGRGLAAIRRRRRHRGESDGGSFRLSRRAGHSHRGKDVPMPYAANLEKLALPNVKEVVEAAKAVMYR